MEELIVEEEKIREVAEERKCPYCEKKGVVTCTGGIGTGVSGPPDYKLPEADKYVFRCEGCNKSFMIPKSLYDKYE